ncbi:MAG: hypothetical protein Q9214_005094, partial [Letrouitia sp. 1 TL-2023]
TIVGQNGNGSYKEVQIYGGDKYEELMYRLSLPSSKHLSPPYQSIWEEIVDKPRQLRRRALRSLGFPPSHNVAIIADLLKQLHNEILGYDNLGTRFDAALVTSPNLIALYQEDLIDAIEYFGIMPPTALYSASNRNAYNQPRNALAGFAGNGMGLCKNVTDEEACKEEEGKMPIRLVYTLEYTNTSLHVRIDLLAVAHLQYESYEDGGALTSFDLGTAKRDQRIDKSVYWAEVRVFLAKLPRRWQYYGGIDNVVLLGNGALDREFVQIVYETVKDFQPGKRDPVFSVTDPTFAAARGALELAERCLAEREEGKGLMVLRHRSWAVDLLVRFMQAVYWYVI